MYSDEIHPRMHNSFLQTAPSTFIKFSSIDEKPSAFCNQSIFQHKQRKELLEMFLCLWVMKPNVHIWKGKGIIAQVRMPGYEIFNAILTFSSSPLLGGIYDSFLRNTVFSSDFSF